MVDVMSSAQGARWPMTMPEERTRSVLQARELLIALSKNASMSEDLRGGAKALLRHFPSEDDMLNVVRFETNPDHYSPWSYKTFGIPSGSGWSVVMPEQAPG